MSVHLSHNLSVHLSWYVDMGSVLTMHFCFKLEVMMDLHISVDLDLEFRKDPKMSYTFLVSDIQYLTSNPQETIVSLSIHSFSQSGNLTSNSRFPPISPHCLHHFQCHHQHHHHLFKIIIPMLYCYGKARRRQPWCSDLHTVGRHSLSLQPRDLETELTDTD